LHGAPPMGERVLVTGGGGFLGRFTVEALRAAGHTVDAPRSRDYDLTRQAAVQAMMGDLRPHTVVHLAAACGGIQANVASPGRFLYENALMGLMVLEEARRVGVSRLVLISTTCAYPQDAPLPLNECDFWNGPPTGATGPYGMAKRLLHEACATYERQYGFQSVVLVPANLYGPGDHFDPAQSHVVPALIRRYVEAADTRAASVVNWGSGRATREFLHVRDAAAGIVAAVDPARSPGVAPINLGTGRETSIAELTAAVARAAGFTGETLWDTTKPEGQPRRFLDVTRARDALGFEARVDLDAGLSETVSWFRENRP
jgi:GDP-L-fucose synthase